MREVICIHVGQAGVQISNAAWELFCVEHGIEANGTLKLNLLEDDSKAFKTFFSETSTGQYVPRCITLDLEPTVIDEVRKGVYRNLFHPDNLLNVYDDGCNNYARGHFTIGRTLLKQAMEVLRKLVEECDCLQGFFIMHSQSGGTGAGFTSLVMDSTIIEFAKQPRYQMSIFPSGTLSVSVVEPYNCVIALKDNINQSDISNIFNNDAAFNICTNLLNINHPTFSNINRILSHIFSDVTVSLRFESTLNSDLSQIGTNLIPYPRIHFITASHAPLSSQLRAEHEKVNVNLLTRDLFRASNQLITCEISNSIYMSCILQYRGQVSPKEVSTVLGKMKKKREIRFVDWCPTGFKLGINCKPPVSIVSSGIAESNKSATMLVNGSFVKVPMMGLMKKFDLLFSRRSFIHWFVGEGMEEGEFNDACDEIYSVVSDYEEVAVYEGEVEEEESTASIRKSKRKASNEKNPNENIEEKIVMDINPDKNEGLSKEDINFSEMLKQELAEDEKKTNLEDDDDNDLKIDY